jgi:hypothetical protein
MKRTFISNRGQMVVQGQILETRYDMHEELRLLHRKRKNGIQRFIQPR